jgi:hypothetical protein
MSKTLRTALEHITKIPTLSHGVLVKLSDVEAAIKAALEAGDRPVAWMYTSQYKGNERYITHYQNDLKTYKAVDVWPLYTTPQQGHWCTYCGGINAHNCQFNTTIPRTQIYTTNHTGEIDGKTSPRR